MRSAARKVRASNKGIEDMSNDGDDPIPAPNKKPRSKPFTTSRTVSRNTRSRTTTPQSESRGVSVAPSAPSTAGRKRGRPQKPNVDDDAIEIIDLVSSHEVEEKRLAHGAEASSSASIVSEEQALKGAPKKRRITDQVKVDSVAVPDVSVEVEKRRAPRRSMDSGYSTYNPFQSGAEEALEKEKRRRKVGCIMQAPCELLTAVLDWTRSCREASRSSIFRAGAIDHPLRRPASRRA